MKRNRVTFSLQVTRYEDGSIYVGLSEPNKITPYDSYSIAIDGSLADLREVLSNAATKMNQSFRLPAYRQS